MTKHFACVFLVRRNQYTNVEKMFLLLKLILYISNSTIHKLTFDRCHQLAERCDRRRAERNYTRCKYQHMYLQLERFNKWVHIPRSFIPGKLVLYISRPFSKFHSRPFARRSVYQCDEIYRWSIDFIALIPQKLTINAPTLVTSASHKITAKCGILCPKTLVLNGETAPRHTFLCSDFQCLPPGDPIILCA